MVVSVIIWSTFTSLKRTYLFISMLTAGLLKNLTTKEWLLCSNFTHIQANMCDAVESMIVCRHVLRVAACRCVIDAV